MRSARSQSQCGPPPLPEWLMWSLLWGFGTIMYSGLWVFFGNCQLPAYDCKESQPEAGTAPESALEGHRRAWAGSTCTGWGVIRTKWLRKTHLGPSSWAPVSWLPPTLGKLYLDFLLTLHQTGAGTHIKTFAATSLGQLKTTVGTQIVTKTSRADPAGTNRHRASLSKATVSEPGYASHGLPVSMRTSVLKPSHLYLGGRETRLGAVSMSDKPCPKSPNESERLRSLDTVTQKPTYAVYLQQPWK